MYQSINTFTDPENGICGISSVLADDGSLKLVLRSNVGTPKEATSELQVPRTLLPRVLAAIVKTTNMERGRTGQSPLSLIDPLDRAGEDGEDDDDE